MSNFHFLQGSLAMLELSDDIRRKTVAVGQLRGEVIGDGEGEKFSGKMKILSVGCDQEAG